MRYLDIAAAVATISAWIVAVYFQWQGDASLQRNILIGTGLAFLVVVAARRVIERRTPRAHPYEQTDVMRIAVDFNREYEVFYPRSFKRPPLLHVECVSGQVDFDVIEQRADGFKLRTRGGSAAGPVDGIRLKWSAKGEV